MAKRGKTTKTKAQTKQQSKPKARAAARPSEVKKMIPADELRNLVRRVESCKQDASSASGRAGEMIKHAIETKGVDRVGFGLARRLAAIKDGHKLQTTLDFLDYARDVLGIDERAAKQAKMFSAEETGAKAGNGAGRKPFRAPVRGEGFKPVGETVAEIAARAGANSPADADADADDQIG